MESTYLTQEYCSRMGLRNANGDKAEALKIAQKRYQSFVGRDVTGDEIRAMQLLIEEISSWSAPKSYVISAA